MSTPTLRAASYARVSTENQRKKSKANPAEGSCETQFQNCRDFARTHDLAIVAEYKDEGISGDASDRPGYMTLLAAAERGEFDVILANEISRLWRNKAETWRCVEDMQHRGIRILTRDGLDSDDPATQYLLAFKSVSSADDIKQTSTRTYDQQAKLARGGKIVGGCPYGYRHRHVTDGKHLDRHGNPVVLETKREKHPQQAPIVRNIFTWFAEGRSTRDIARELNRAKVPSPGSTWARNPELPNGRRCSGWVGSAIYQMLQNEMYRGMYIWNRCSWPKAKAGLRLRKVVRNPRDQWITTPRPDLAIVDAALWKRTQSRFRQRSQETKTAHSGGTARYVLSGLLECGECGSNYTLQGKVQYGCASADSESHDCKNKILLRRDLAEELILGPLDAQLLEPKMVALMAREILSEYEARMTALQQRREERPVELTALEERIGRLRARLRNGDPDMPADELQLAVDRAEAKRAELVASLPAAKASAKVLTMLPRAAAAYRRQIAEGLSGNVRAAARARAAVRQLAGGKIKLLPDRKAGHLIASFSINRLPLVRAAGGIGSVGSGGRI